MKRFQNVQSKIKQDFDQKRPGTASTIKSKKNIGSGQVAFGKTTTSFINKAKQHDDKENFNENNINHEDDINQDDVDIDHHETNFINEEDILKEDLQAIEKHKNYGKVPCQ